MKIKEIVRNTKRLEGQILALKKRYDDNKALIQKYFDEHPDIKRIEVEGSQEEGSTDPDLYAIKVEKVTIKYLPEMLKAKLSKDLFDEVTRREYSIVDMERLKRLLRKAGVSPDEFKKCIKVTYIPDNAAIQRLYASKDITKSQLQGCYDAVLTKYIQIYTKKGDSD